MTRLLLVGLAVAGCSSLDPDLPNFVLIVTDDQGYADLGVFGSGSAPEGPPWNDWDRIAIPTPRIDQLAGEGMRFTAFYSGHHRCTPSRASLLTGAYPSRVGFGDIVVFPEDQHGLHPNEVTLAEMLRARGYATAVFGKWHLGHETPFLPLQQGFDEYVGMPYSHNLWADPYLPLASDVRFREGWSAERIEGLKERTTEMVKAATENTVSLMRGNEVVEYPTDLSQFTTRITDEAIGFVREHRDHPFFLYLPHSMPHVPIEVPERFRGATDRGPYGNALAEVDFQVGRLVDAIDAEGLADETLILFTSDNGPWTTLGDRGGTAYPFRGGKSSHFEGGFRVPTIMRWPGRIPDATTQHAVASFVDLYPTLSALSGRALPRDRQFDGHDLTAVLEGSPDSPHDALFYNVDAVRRGAWKWVEGMLFDLDADPGETTDLAETEPALADDLRTLVQDHRRDLEESGRPLGTPAALTLPMGCTDPDARNFDRRAEVDDGSCR